MSKYKINKNKRKRYSNAGVMYAPNEIGQGLNPNSTENIVYEENNPQILAQSEQALEQEKASLIEKSELASQAFDAQKEKDSQTIEENDSRLKNTFTAVEGAVDQGLKKFSNLGNTARNAVGATSLFSGRAARLGVRANRLAKAGKQAKAAKLFTRSGQAHSANAARVGNAGRSATTAGRIGSGLKNFATSGAGLGTIANYTGKAISKLSDDKDATKWNAGEVTGDLLSSTGQGAAWGSMLGPVGTAVGAVAGLAYGVGKGLIGRRRARRTDNRQTAKLKAATTKFNKEQEDSFASNWARNRKNEMYGKTYSGYDIGRNTTAKYGGLKKYI